MCVCVMDEGSCRRGGVAGENIASGVMRGRRSGRGDGGMCCCGRNIGVWLNAETREASVNYKQRVRIRRGIRVNGAQNNNKHYWRGSHMLVLTPKSDGELQRSYKGGSVQPGLSVAITSTWVWPTHKDSRSCCRGDRGQGREGGKAAVYSLHPALACH